MKEVLLLGQFLGKFAINYPDIRTKVVFLTWLFIWLSSFQLKKIMQLNEPLAKFVTLVSFENLVVKTLREKLELLKRCNTVRNKTLPFRKRNRYLKWKCLSYQRFPNGLYTW